MIFSNINLIRNQKRCKITTCMPVSRLTPTEMDHIDQQRAIIIIRTRTQQNNKQHQKYEITVKTKTERHIKLKHTA